MKITISDQAKAICALEEERKCLYAQSRMLSEEQIKIADEFKARLTQLSIQHRNIMKLMMAIDDNMKRLLMER